MRGIFSVGVAELKEAVERVLILSASGRDAGGRRIGNVLLQTMDVKRSIEAVEDGLLGLLTTLTGAHFVREGDSYVLMNGPRGKLHQLFPLPTPVGETVGAILPSILEELQRKVDAVIDEFPQVIGVVGRKQATSQFGTTYTTWINSVHVIEGDERPDPMLEDNLLESLRQFLRSVPSDMMVVWRVMPTVLDPADNPHSNTFRLRFRYHLVAR